MMNLLARLERQHKYDPTRRERDYQLRKRYLGEGKTEVEFRLDAIELRQDDLERLALKIATKIKGRRPS